MKQWLLMQVTVSQAFLLTAALWQPETSCGTLQGACIV